MGIEDCRHLSARLERDVAIGDEHVVPVPPGLVAQTRASARTHSKPDPFDAIARAVLRAPDLSGLAQRDLAETENASRPA